MIYQGSRYSKTHVHNKDGVSLFKIRSINKFNLDKCVVHTLIQGETLDGLADKYYNDSQLWWAILEANSKYASYFDIKPGDEIFIPNYEEVVSKI